MSKTLRLCLALSLLPLLAGALPALAADSSWVEVKSPHFTIVSDAGDRRVRDVAWQFEQVRAAMQAFWPWARTTLDRPVVVIAARDEASMRALLPQYWEKGSASLKPASVFVGGPDAYYIALRSDAQAGNGQPDVNPYFASYWSYGSLVLNDALGRSMPLWFRNGLAEVISNAIVRPDQIKFGLPLPWSLQNLRQEGRLRLAQLMMITDQSPYYTGNTRDLFDAQSWGVMNYLLYGRPDSQANAVNELAQLLSSGLDSAAATQKVFGSLDALEEAYLGYAKQPIFRYGTMRLQTDIAASDFTSRPLTAADAGGMRAALQVSMQRTTDAQASIASARKADPQSPASYAAEGLMLDRDGKREDAVAACRTAADLDSQNF